MKIQMGYAWLRPTKGMMLFRAMVIWCVLPGALPMVAQSYQTRFEQVKFDRNASVRTWHEIVSVEGATGAASVDLPLGPGIGSNDLRFTPAMRLRSSSFGGTRTEYTNPNAFWGTPPFLYNGGWGGGPFYTWAAAMESATDTVSYTAGGDASLAPGSLDLLLPDSRNTNALSVVRYPDGSNSTLGGVVAIGGGGGAYQSGYVPAGQVPSTVQDPSLALEAFSHGRSLGWSVQSLPYLVSNGVASSTSPFVQVTGNGELVVGLSSASAPAASVPLPNLFGQAYRIPRCILVIRENIAYEFAFVGTESTGAFIPLPRTAAHPNGIDKEWLRNAHYVLTRMLNRFGDAILFDHGLNLLGLGTNGVVANGFDYAARWMRNGATTGVSIALTLGNTVPISAQPMAGTTRQTTEGYTAHITYTGEAFAPSFSLTLFNTDGSTAPSMDPRSISFATYESQGMDFVWDSASNSLLPLVLSNDGSQEIVSFSYIAPEVGFFPVLSQVSVSNGRRISLGWGSHRYRPNTNLTVWSGYVGDSGRRDARAYGVTQVADTDAVLNGYATRTTTHTRVVPQPDPSDDSAWTSTTFYDEVTSPDESVKVFFYVEPIQGSAATLQAFLHLDQQVREVREYRDASTWRSDVELPAVSSTADRITIFDHWDLRRVGNTDGDLAILGSHPYFTRTRVWDKERGVLQLSERTAWDTMNFVWGKQSHQSYLSASTPSLTADYPSLAAGGNSTNYANLQRKVDAVTTAMFDAERWIGPLTTFNQGTTASDATPTFTSAGGAAPSAQPPTTTVFLTGTSLPQAVTAGTAGLQVRTTFTYPGAATPTAPTPSDATLTDPTGVMLNSGLVGTTYSYNSLGYLNAIKPKGVGWQAQQSQDAFGRVTSQTGADGVVSWYTWDAAGRLTSSRVGSETATTYTYNDTNHRTVTVTRASQVSELHYDAFGELILEKRTAQGTPSFKVYGRDAMGRVNGETLWLPTTMNGHTVTDADAFQPNLLTTTTATSPGYTVCTMWDSDGNCLNWKTVPPKTTTYPAMYTGTQTFYDGLGRVIEVKGPNGEDLLMSYGSWSGGAQVIRTEVGAQVWNPSTRTSIATNRATTLQYDAEGRLAHVTDPAGQTTDTFYDVMGRLAQVTQHGSGVNQTRTWAYDTLGRVTAMTQPESGTTTYKAFTVTGKPTVTTYGAGSASPRTLTATFDPLDRMTGLASGDGSVTQSFSYADAGAGLATGKLASATSNGITRTLAYGGPAGELSSLTRTVDGNSFVLAYGYDAATGNLTSRTYPDGKVQTISYDAERGLPSGTKLNGTTVASLGYDPISWLLTGLTYGNNGTSVFGYTNERLATMAHAIPGKTLASWAFTYDQAGQLGNDSEDWFGYDILGRLQNAYVRDPQDSTAGHGLAQAFRYDAFGNRTSLGSQKVTNWAAGSAPPTSPTLTALGSDPRPLRTYAMNASEITGMGATNRLPSTVGGVATGASYDAQGNLTAIYGTPGSSATQLTLTYDSLGRVTTLGDTAHATSQTYGFDDEGLRIKTVDSATGLTSYNIYDEGRRLIAQYTVPSGGSLTWKKDLIYIGAKEVAEVDSTGKTWVEFLDHLGSPRFTWDGTATSTMDGVHLIAQKYAPFGEYLNDPTTQAKFAKGFTNHEQTDPSGLIYMQARFYLPMYGRFASPDPARDQHFEQTQSWNIYSYVQNNPTMLIDPDGMMVQDPNYKISLGARKPQILIVHDTAGQLSRRGFDGMKSRQETSGHLYVDRTGEIWENHPLSKDAPATKAEWKSTKGEKHIDTKLTVNVELNNPIKDPSITDKQYGTLAQVAVGILGGTDGSLTISPHREIDRGIAGGHEDPRGFDVGKFETALKAACKEAGIDYSRVKMAPKEAWERKNQKGAKRETPPEEKK